MCSKTHQPAPRLEGFNSSPTPIRVRGVGGRAGIAQGALPVCRVGSGAEPNSPRSQSNRDEVGAHPNRVGLVWGPGGRNAPWSMGSTGSADSSLGRPERVRVSGQERPDWRVSGASTLTSDQPAKRLHGARCWSHQQSRAMRRRGCNGERASGFPLPRLCGRTDEILFRLYYTHISCGHPYAGFAETGTMLRLRKDEGFASHRLQDDGRRCATILLASMELAATDRPASLSVPTAFPKAREQRRPHEKPGDVRRRVPVTWA